MKTDNFLLDGLWQIKLPNGRALEANVPGCWENYVDEKDIGGEVIYEKTFDFEPQQGFYSLNFAAVSYYCEISLNGIQLGTHEGMWDAFSVDATSALKKGQNILRLSVYKPGYNEGDKFPVREVLSGFIPDVLFSFGGIWGSVELRHNSGFAIINHSIAGSADGAASLLLGVESRRNIKAQLKAEIFSPNGQLCAKIEKTDIKINGENEFEFSAKVENPQLWCTEAPALYSYKICIEDGEGKAEAEGSFGFRDVCANGSRILINNEPVYLRGLLHWGFYDDIIIPRPPREVIEREIEDVREYGFNIIKHCLYIPSEEYLKAADESGMLLWVELPVWLQDPAPQLEERIRREFPRLLRALRGHPSIILVSLGCELNDVISGDILQEMYIQAKTLTKTLVRDNSGSGECYDGLAVDYADFFDYHFYGDLHNMENLMEVFTPAWRSTRPWIYGEFCDSDTLRDLDEQRADLGVKKLMWEENDASKNPISSLKPDFRLHLHDERMLESGIRAEYPMLKELSRRHTMVHRKTTLEMTRSFSEIAGYNITSIKDVPIATSGMFDYKNDFKFDAKIMRSINSARVLCPAWDLTRVWINADRVQNRERYNFFAGEVYSLHVLLSNFGERAEGCAFEWRLVQGGKELLCGKGENDSIFESGSVSEAAYIHFNIPQIAAPASLRLEVSVMLGEETVTNSWPVFVYEEKQQSAQKSIALYDPLNVFTGIEKCFDDVKQLEENEEVPPQSLLVTSLLNKQAQEFAKNGGKVFCIQRGKGALPSVPVAFWREGMLRSYYEHPVLSKMQDSEWDDNLRWFSLSTDTALDVGGMKQAGFENARPILRRYDCREWTATDYLAQYDYGGGQVIAGTLRFEGGQGKQPLIFKNNRLAKVLLNNIIDMK